MKHLLPILKQIEIDLKSNNTLSRPTYELMADLSDWELRIINDFILRVRMNNDPTFFVYKIYDIDYPPSTYADKPEKDLLIASLKRTEKDTLITDVKNKLVVPTTISYDHLIVYGMPVTRARNFAVDYALRNNFRYILFLDDDILAPINLLLELWNFIQDNPDILAVGANYYRKTEPLISAHVYSEVKDNIAIADKVLAMGATLINLKEVIKKVPAPLFWEFGAPDGFWSMGEDAFFTKNLIYYTNTYPVVKLDVECLHYDKQWKKMYGNFNPDIKYASGLIEDFEAIRVPPKFPLIVICLPTRTETEPIACDFSKLGLLRGYRTEFARVANYPVDEARNILVEHALKKFNADYILFVDNDVVPPQDGLDRLIEVMESSKQIGMVCGDYPTKFDLNPVSNVTVVDPANDGIVTELDRSSLKDKDLITDHIWVTGLGFALIRKEVFLSIPYPYFKCFEHKGDKGINEDSYFCEHLLKAGWKIVVNRKVKCLHLDFNKKKVYFFQNEKYDLSHYATSLDLSDWKN